MLNYEYFQAVAGCIILIPLIRGAIADVKTRTFPKEYWRGCDKIAGLFAVIMYLLMIAKGEFYLAATLLILSVIAWIVFAAVGYRYGGGGDWRALIYCAVIAPLIFFTLYFWILFCLISIALGFFELSRKSDKHIFERHIPWAVAICLSFVITLILFVVP